MEDSGVVIPLQLLRDIAVFASSDKSRPSLCDVRISDGYVWATDSYVLARHEFTMPEGMNLSFPASLLAAFTGGAASRAVLVQPFESDGQFGATLTEGGTSVAGPATAGGGSRIEYRTVVPLFDGAFGFDADLTEVRFDPKLLARIFKVRFGASKERGVCDPLRIFGMSSSLKAAWFGYFGFEVLVMLMCKPGGAS